MLKNIEALGFSSCNEFLDIQAASDTKQDYIINKINPENRRQVREMFNYEAGRYVKHIEETVDRDHVNRAGGRTESCARILDYYLKEKELSYRKLIKLLPN